MEAGLRERQKGRRRSQILAAARELLRENPAAVPSTERIAERAEVAPATVYNLIGPRDRLWAALAAEFTEELETRLASRPARDPLARARHVVTLSVDLFIEDPSVARGLVRGWRKSGSVLDRGPATALQEALAEAQAGGILRDDIDVRATTAVIADACLGAVQRWGDGLLDDRRLRVRALRALDLAVAATAVDERREGLLRPLRRRRKAA